MTNLTQDEYNKEEFLYPRANSKNANINIWSVFPAIKNFGMSALGFLSIFKMFDMREDYFVERIFSDTQTTKIPYKDVDVLFLSFIFEFDILQIFKIFDRYNIPYKAKDRDESHPIVIIGGPVMCANPEPFCEFFDCITIGDAEQSDKELIDVIRNNRHLNKKEIIDRLSQIDWVYVPAQTSFDKEKMQTTKKRKAFHYQKTCFRFAKLYSNPNINRKFIL